MMTRQHLRLYWLSLVILALVPLVLLLGNSSPGIDISWLTYLGREALRGADIGKDYMEVNPPGIIYLYLPSVWLGEKTGVAAPYWLHLQSWCALLISLMACRRVMLHAIRHQLLDDTGYRMGMAVLVFLLSWLPLQYQTASQREHWLMLFALPWLLAQLLDSARLHSHKARWLLVLAAAIGVAIKPYFAILPLMLGLWYPVYAARSAREQKQPALAAFMREAKQRWFSVDYLPMVGFQLCYLAFLVWVEKDYIQHALPIAMATYRGFAENILETARKLLVSFVVALLPLLMAKPTQLWRQLLVQRQLMLMAGAALVVWAQMKGFSYHFYPLWLVVGLSIWCCRAEDVPDRPVGEHARVFIHRIRFILHRSAWFLPLVFCLGLAGRGAMEQLVHEEQLVTTRLEAILDRHHINQQDTVQIWKSPGHPAIMKRGLTTSLPVLHPWFLAAFYDFDEPAGFSQYTLPDAPNPFRTPAEMPPAERYMFDLVIRRFLENPPAIVIMDTQPWQQGFGFIAFDFWRYYSQDAAFKKAWQDYALVERDEPYDIWVRH